MVKRIFILIISILTIAHYCYSQSYDKNKVSVANYITRMYANSPFEGVKVLDGNGITEPFLISVVKLNKEDYSSEQILNRVAEVKARSQASRYFNGANITSDMIIVIRKDSMGVVTNSTEIIKESSYGNVETLELLSTFTPDSGNATVFIFYSPINNSKTCKKFKRNK